MADDDRPEPDLAPDLAPEPATEPALEPEPAPEPAPEPDSSAAAPRARGIGRTVTVISLRVVRGLVGAAAALAVILAVGFVPLPTVGIAPLAVRVEPQPADLLALCSGALLRLGDDAGENAGQPTAVGVPELTVAASGGSVERSALGQSDAGTGGTPQAPVALRVASSANALLSVAQSQNATGEGGLRGFAAASCPEPTSSAWLVGGATTVGRTTLLLLANPTAVTAQVTVSMWGESGPVTAPGMSGISVPAGGQRVLPLSGFAPGLSSPVLHVEARGGQVVAALQTSVIRVLDPGGVDLVSAGAPPARAVTIPAVRIFDEQGVSSSLGIAGYDDLEAVLRVGNPGEAEAKVEVSVVPAAAGGSATSFDLEIDPGGVLDTPLAAALPLGAAPFSDGSYTVTVTSDQPVVAGVRTSTATTPSSDADGGLQPGRSDLAWAASAPALRGDVAVAVADGPAPMLALAAADGLAHTVTLTPLGAGNALTLAVPASGSLAVAVAPGGYRLTGTAGVAAALSFAGAGALAGYPLASPREADSVIVVRP
ncbi:MAG: hypothetical protein DI534_08035 [Leifsonia xyli]|nr:MAG: hypothetical protein DI534_08035 [Leifsonia xyli]